jgi:hypothetical protein
MATHENPIRLTDEQMRLLNELSARTGRPSQELLEQALKELRNARAPETEDRAGINLFERLSQSGLLGCLDGGPADLSTNPKHMEGFGE